MPLVWGCYIRCIIIHCYQSPLPLGKKILHTKLAPVSSTDLGLTAILEGSHEEALGTHWEQFRHTHGLVLVVGSKGSDIPHHGLVREGFRMDCPFLVEVHSTSVTLLVYHVPIKNNNNKNNNNNSYEMKENRKFMASECYIHRVNLIMP